MIRQIIKIDEEKCNGCGLCANACHEGAIVMQNGKAVLTRDDYCDGLGNCLPVCKTGAITFEEREAAAFDESAVKKHKQTNNATLPCGCPSTNATTFKRQTEQPLQARDKQSQLQQFPIQLQLVPVNASYFKDCDLLIAADCTAFAYGDFHHDFIKGKITLIGCPKLDATEYSEKLTQILLQNEIRSLTVVIMEVPCCQGLTRAVKTALKNSEKIIPWRIVTIARNGEIL